MKRIKLFDEFSANRVVCDNCGWQWRLEEGGEDVYICHECGHDNSPTLMQEAEETYSDYPAAAKKNAKQAIEWRDKYGRDEVDAGTAVGWQRANQLAKGEKLSADVVSRMAQFNRHRKNSKIATEFKETPWRDKGYLSWLLWGGDAGVDWAMKKMDEIRKE